MYLDGKDRQMNVWKDYYKKQTLSSGALCILSYLLNVLESSNKGIKQWHVF